LGVSEGDPFAPLSFPFPTTKEFLAKERSDVPKGRYEIMGNRINFRLENTSFAGIIKVNALSPTSASNISSEFFSVRGRRVKGMHHIPFGASIVRLCAVARLRTRAITVACPQLAKEDVRSLEDHPGLSQA
jgi:hypothetical protein